MRLRQLIEAPRTAVMAFGRMNPPTIGHAKLVDAVKSQGGDPYIFLSQSQKPKTDPLSFQEKLRYAKFFFPEITIGHPEVRTIIQALQKIEQLGYENIIYVAGSDRVESFKELINKYNGKEYNFKSIEIVSAGERDPDADGAEGMSASKMRAAAAADDLDSFTQGVPNKEVADEMFAAVRQGMGIQEPVAAEEAPPGREKQVKKLKQKFPDDEDAPYAIAWAQHNKHGEPNNESLVLDKSRLRSHIISLIADKIAETDDIDQLAEWLKLIVGKELKPRQGSDYRYVISNEDIVNALEACKSRRKKMRETQDTLPDKMKPFLEPFPEIPQAQAQPYTTDDGAQISPMRGGGVKLSDDRGTFIWDPQGKPLTYTTPKIQGFHQVHDMKTGNFIVYLDNGTLSAEQEYDKNGNKIGGAGASFDAGPVSVTRDRSGNKSATYTMGQTTTNVPVQQNGS